MAEMSTLTIELGDGFSDDEVTVLIDGKRAWRKAGITTNYSVGLADLAHIPVATSTGPRFTVEVQARGQSGSHELDRSATPELERLRVDIDVTGSLELGAAQDGPVF